MKKIKINDIDYELIKEYKNGFDLTAVLEKCKDIDYFDAYDYIFGDWAYGKLRLKGLYNKSNSKVNETNSYEKIDDYINKYCAYECRYFIIKKLKK